jgi:hypothetical protein
MRIGRSRRAGRWLLLSCMIVPGLAPCMWNIDYGRHSHLNVCILFVQHARDEVLYPAERMGSRDGVALSLLMRIGVAP